MSGKGETWNESIVVEDPLTLKKKRRITSYGQYNVAPGYHTGDTFTEDGDYMIFATGRQGKSAICKAHTETGDITCLIDPVDGTGTAEEMQANELERGYIGNGRGIGYDMEILPKSRMALYDSVGRLKTVHLDSLEEKTLLEYDENQVFTGSSVTPDEKNFYFTFIHKHPQIQEGKWATKPLRDAYRDAGIEPAIEIYRMPVSGGSSELVYREAGLRSGHIQICPTDPDLLLFNRDRGDNEVNSDNADQTRTWLLRLSTGELTDLAPADKSHFQIHATWSWDGKSIIYHGPSSRGGWYIGITGTDGKVIREFCFPEARFYGHVSAMPDRPAIIIDGNLTDDTMQWLYYDKEQPRLEAIARHNTNWTGMPWQYPHPHASSSKDGRFISFCAASKEWTGRCRNDLWLVEV